MHDENLFEDLPDRPDALQSIPISKVAFPRNTLRAGRGRLLGMTLQKQGCGHVCRGIPVTLMP